MNTNFEFNSKLIVRTPKLTQKDTEADVMLLLHDDSFLESVYIASPGLYNECLKLKEGGILTAKEEEKVKNSLMKYHFRMGTRSTPFGLFSGCHVSNWTDEETGITISKNAIKRHTRLDMHYLCALSQNLASRPGIKENIKFVTNNSIYIIGSELRYVEYSYQKDSRNYQICSVENNEYLQIIATEAKIGKYISEIVQVVCNQDQDVLESQVADFLDELINSQILISALEPSTTGADFLVSIIATLQNISIKNTELENTILMLKALDATLAKIDNNEFTTVEGYKTIVGIVEELGIPYDESKLFHTDIYKTEISGGINAGIKTRLAAVAEMLNKITTYTENANLKNFKENFYKRYEEKEMPLLKVLDTETGIGYLNNVRNQDITPLIDDIMLPAKGKATLSLNWNELEQMLHKKTIDSKNNVIEIVDEDLKDFEANWNNLPPSFPMMFKILSADEIFVESCGGSSAVNLLGRFANGDAEINEVAQAIADKEQELDDNVVFAEIIHLPESRISNILIHPPFRKYEIPYLCNASTDAEHTIDVSDLYVSIKNGKVVLRSKKLNKIVIPRLSNAHNYSHNALPVYQFLCDLQNQGKRGGIFFHWGGLGKIHQKFPRVKYKNCILSLAQWNIKQADVKDILNAGGAERRTKVDAFLQKWGIPRYVVLAEGDNELFIDFENEKLINIWVEYIKKRNSTILKEFIPSTHGVVDDVLQHNFNNQVIALVQSIKPSYNTLTVNAQPKAAIPRSFSLGSEWLYFKIYCGVRSADKILTDVIKPITEELEATKMIDKWFFIRFNDPDFHLRVRFHVTDVNHIGHIVQTFNKYAAHYLQGGTIWKIQNDTYNREVERYGSTSIELAESIFYHDSASVLSMISSVQNNEREDFRWMWAVKSIDELFKSFGVSLDHRFEIMDELKDAFALEFNSNKLLKVQFDAKYRQYRGKLDKWLANEGLLLEDPQELETIRALFERTRFVTPLVHELNSLSRQGTLEVTTVNFLGSLIHMIVNRVITSQQRLHELIIYDFMSRLYKSSIAIAKQTNNKKDVIKVPSL
jgi:thiopeptide-type bacteriocin biosynthesis protein